MINYEKEMIRVQGLKKSFGKLPVLCGIDQVIYEGEVVSIIGPSGSGKSTFLRCLNLLEKPEEGQVFFEGTEITNKKLKKKELDQYRQKIGMVFQHFHVFPHLKVIENITLAPILEKKMEKAKAETDTPNAADPARMAIAAPKAAPCEAPRMSGDTSGF